MNIIYMHHAQRQITKGHNDPALRQIEDLTKKGIKEAKLLARDYKNNKQNIVAIVTSPYIRCKHTAQIINKYLNVPIIEDERFNEKDKEETWQNLLNRNIKAIDDIVKKYKNDETIICVTSGINLSAFICYFYNIPIADDVPWTQGMNISPINFKYDKE